MPQLKALSENSTNYNHADNIDVVSNVVSETGIDKDFPQWMDKEIDYSKVSGEPDTQTQSGEKVHDELSLTLPIEDYGEALKPNTYMGNEIPEALQPKDNLEGGIQKANIGDYYDNTKKEGLLSRLKKKIMGSGKKERTETELEELEERFDKIREG